LALSLLNFIGALYNGLIKIKIMKAYKFNRTIAGWHWSNGVSESMIYIPDANTIIYEGSDGKENYFGVTTDSKFVDEAKEYVDEIQNGTVKKFLSAEHEEANGPINNFKDFSKYSPEVLLNTGKKYIKVIPERKFEDNVTSAAITLSNFEEFEIDSTLEEIKELDNKQIDFTFKKCAFQLEKESFKKEIDNFINLAKKI
jgi:hypothetical protein